jgi:hypothetical protein
MKVLNLDSLAKPTKTVTLGGKTYTVKEMSVEGFIEFTRHARQFEDKELKPEDSIGLMIKTVGYALPDVPEQELQRLSIGQLTALVDHINSSAIEDAVDNKTEEGAPGKS